jgi:hypothetical protein
MMPGGGISDFQFPRSRTMSKRAKYNRGSIDSTMAAALKVSAEKAVYVFPTGVGFAIDDQPAPFGNRCYKVFAGQVNKVGNWPSVAK